MTENLVQFKELSQARQEYELARACALLAVAISTAVLISNFGPVPKAVGEADKLVVVHQKILREHEDILRQNESVLRENQALLASRRTVSTQSK